MLDCNHTPLVITFMIPLVIGLVIGVGIDETYFKIDRDQYVNESCASVERINAFTCPAYAETMPLWIMLVPISFIGLSFIIQLLYYNIKDLLDDRKGSQSIEDVRGLPNGRHEI